MQKTVYRMQGITIRRDMTVYRYKTMPTDSYSPIRN